MYCSLFSIFFCFITLRLPQLIMFTGVKFSSQNIFWVDQPWQIYDRFAAARNFIIVATTITVYLNYDLLILSALLYTVFLTLFSHVLRTIIRTVLNFIIDISNSLGWVHINSIQKSHQNILFFRLFYLLVVTNEYPDMIHLIESVTQNGGSNQIGVI